MSLRDVEIAAQFFLQYLSPEFPDPLADCSQIDLRFMNAQEFLLTLIFIYGIFIYGILFR
jgi:hypothetical protein